MDELEVTRQPRRPLFVFFPTITTHVPFVPTPPYQPDWTRILTISPYDTKDLDEAWSDYPDWMNLGPSYVKALAYAYATIGGYLRLRADRDFVVLLIGDHQPPSLVSGDGADVGRACSRHREPPGRAGSVCCTIVSLRGWRSPS